MMSIELNYSISNKEMLVVEQSLEEWRAYLKGLQSNKPFLLYSDHCSLECFITTKKLLAYQACQTEFLFQFHFKLTYCTRKFNKRANTLSYKTENVQDQKEIIDYYYTQTILLRDKLDQLVINNLHLSHLTQLLGEIGPLEPNSIEVSPINTTPNSKDYDSLQLIAYIIENNKASPDLEDLYTRATISKDDVQTLQDGILL